MASLVSPIPATAGRVARRLLLCAAALALPSACAPRSCANPYVLEFLDRADAQSSLAHVGLLRAPVTTAPGATPDALSCSAWEQVRAPGGDGRIVLRPQYFSIRHVGDGWELGS